MDIKKKFGLTVKKLRLRNKQSQEKFSLSIGVDRTYLASIESGKRNVSIANIEKIAIGFGVSLSDLFMIVDSIDKQ